MTTSVTIKACLADTKEVKINLADSNGNPEEWTLQNGEEIELHVYDDRAITVKEVEK